MSNRTWIKKLGGSLAIYQQERSKYMQMTFYVSPNYYTIDKNGVQKKKSNGMFEKSLKPITTKLEAERMAKKIYKDFDIEKYSYNPDVTTFDDVAKLAFDLRKKDYKIKERFKLEHNPTFISTAIKELNTYEREIKPVFGKINIKDRDLLQSTMYDFVDQLTTIGTSKGNVLSHNRIAKYLNIIGFIQKQAVARGLLPLMCKNPPLERRSNARVGYRMMEVKKITDMMMNEYKASQDMFMLDLHDYIQFLISAPTRFGMETITIQKKDCKIVTNKEGVEILYVHKDNTKTGSHSYTVSPEFLHFHGKRFLQNFYAIDNDNDYIWFTNSQKTRSTIQERVRKNFVRISKKLNLYMFNGQERPMTSIRHMGIRRMKKEGVEGVAQIYNTSEDMTNKHYNKESDERSIAEDFNKTYAKRLKILK
jgi:hypothetical protein